MKQLRAFGRSAAGRTMLLVAAAFLGVAGGTWARGASTAVPPVDLTTDATGLMQTIATAIDTTYPGDYTAAADAWYAQNVAADDGPEMAQGYAFRIYSPAEPQVRIGPAQPTSNSAPSSSFVPKTTTDQVAGTIDALLRQHGFFKSSSSHDLSDFTIAITYMHNDQTCILQNNKSTYQLSVRCHSPEILRELAKQYQPFVNTYLAAHPDVKATGLAFGPLTVKSQQGSGAITASETKGYDIAEALALHNGTTVLALYYQKGRSPWHYVTEAADEFGFNCAAIQKNPDARRAFYDQVCYDATTHAQQRLDSSRRALQ